MKWEKAGMEEYGGGHEMAEGAQGSSSGVRLGEMKWEKAGMEEYGGGHEMAEGAQGSSSGV